VKWQNKIFKNHSTQEFEDLALEVFRYQLTHCKVYSEYANALGKINPSKLSEIPFLPISFYKSRKIISDTFNTHECVFKSSGTQGERSTHYVADTDIYKKSFDSTYRSFIGNPEDQIIIGLLPNYVEQGDSSLVYMVNHLIETSKNNGSQFFLSELEQLQEVVTNSNLSGKQLVVIGVAYSLLDLCDLGVNLSNAIVIETGGMKGRRKELSKENLHSKLIKELNIIRLYSEYGMTEMLSQAYCTKDFQFQGPPWMRVLIRDLYDPLSIIGDNKRGGINIIDLANVFGCSFIATEDTGIKIGDKFQLMGRIEKSDLRGCNLLVE
jgi:hypothetical protein